MIKRHRFYRFIPPILIGLAAMFLEKTYPVIEHGFFIIGTQAVLIFTLSPYFGTIGGAIMGFLALIASPTPIEALPAATACAAIGYFGKRYEWKAIILAPFVGLPIMMILKTSGLITYQLDFPRVAFFSMLSALILSATSYSIYKRLRYHEGRNIEDLPALEFMAHVVGLGILHPGGFKTTDKLAELCEITQGSRVLDIGCGKGTSAIYLAKKFGCQVVGIDDSEKRIAEATEMARREGVEGKVAFKVCDAEAMEFPESSFDVAITQAALIFMDMEKVIKEAVKVVRRGGFVGVAELTWKKEPSPGFIEETVNVLKEDCIRKALTEEGWARFLETCGLGNIRHARVEMWAPKDVLKERKINALRVVIKLLSRPGVRKRFFAIGNHFRRHSDVFGFGIHVGQKL
jgi:ubiquinone/menaquinone biosynthesis C-methylase UbiE